MLPPIFYVSVPIFTSFVRHVRHVRHFFQGNYINGEHFRLLNSVQYPFLRQCTQFYVALFAIMYLSWEKMANMANVANKMTSINTQLVKKRNQSKHVESKVSIYNQQTSVLAQNQTNAWLSSFFCSSISDSPSAGAMSSAGQSSLSFSRAALKASCCFTSCSSCHFSMSWQS